MSVLPVLVLQVCSTMPGTCLDFFWFAISRQFIIAVSQDMRENSYLVSCHGQMDWFGCFSGEIILISLLIENTILYSWSIAVHMCTHCCPRTLCWLASNFLFSKLCNTWWISLGLVCLTLCAVFVFSCFGDSQAQCLLHAKTYSVLQSHSSVSFEVLYCLSVLPL